MTYTIDEKAGTITRVIDADLGLTETASLDELVELLFWLKSRERDLRQMAFNHSPVTFRRVMTPINGYYVGMTADRRPVKVKSERWQALMIETEALVRKNWLESIEDRRRLERGPVTLVQYDAKGQPLPTKHDEVLTEADTPLFLIQEVTYKRQQPEYWVDLPDNLDAGKWAKVR